jgi:peptidoglycan/LPS O-acetylase OafA/YrhL
MVWAARHVGSHPLRVVVSFGLSYALAATSARVVEGPVRRRFGRPRLGAEPAAVRT